MFRRRIIVWSLMALAVLCGTALAAAMLVFTDNLALRILGSLALVAIALPAAHVVRKTVKWKALIWLPNYAWQLREPRAADRPLDVMFLFCDHFEPENGGVEAPRQVHRVIRWEENYRNAIRGHTDSDGRPPQHTWFFPIADATKEVRTLIAAWPQLGWGEIEYHLHHDVNYNESQIREQIRRDIAGLQEMGAVPTGRYGFVHGNFALAAGDRRYCKAPHELDVLRETGCYADFTFASLNAPSQPSQVNSIFYARSTGRDKPHDVGCEAQVGRPQEGLLLIPGPLWAGCAFHLYDDAHVARTEPPHVRRIGRWLEAHVHVKGRPNWVFICVHSHSAKEAAQDMLFSHWMQDLWGALEKRFKGPNSRLHYVTAREAYNIVKAAEAGHDGNPADYRDFEIPTPQGNWVSRQTPPSPVRQSPAANPLVG